MCTGAILLYGIPKVVIGENATFLGEEELLASRGVEVVVLNDETCIQMMNDFINDEPTLWNEDIGVCQDLDQFARPNELDQLA